VLTIPVAAFLFIGDIMADSLSDLEYKYYSSVVASDGAVTISIEPSAVAQISSRTAFGDITAPGVGVAIATLSSVPAGTWDITCYTNLAGSAAAGDRPNLAFKVGSTVTSTLLSTMNGYNDTYSIRINLTTPTDLSVNAIAAGTAGAVYRVSMVATRIA
jgi:hypothetical protein